MADGKLYIVTDTFSPGAFRNDAWPTGAERYDHESPFRFITLIPMWEVSSPATPEPPSLGHYFSTWTGADLAQADRVQWLTQDDEAAFNGRVLVPVPFPPETTLQLIAEWTPDADSGETNSAQIVRKLGGYQLSDGSGFLSPPLEICAADWVEFSRANFSFPLAESFGTLSKHDQAQVIDWICNAVVAWRNELETAANEGRDPRFNDLDTEIFDAFVKGTVLEETVDRPDTGADPRDPDRPDSEELLIRRWKAHLRSTIPASNPPTLFAAAIYETMVHSTKEASTLVGEPPQLPVPLKILEADPQLMMPRGLQAGGQTVDQCSYHRRLWENLKSDAARLSEQDLIERVSTLYGYGERLRWPVDASAQSRGHFMIPRPNPQRAPEGWVGTNAYSLLGQVFRLGPVQSTSADPAVLSVSSLELQGIPAPVIVELNDALRELEADHLDLIGEDVSIRLQRDDLPNTDGAGTETGNMRNGIVHYQPKIAEGAPVGLDKPGTEDPLPLYEVPAAVLDLLSSDARQDMPRIDETTVTPGEPKTALVRRLPQRTAIHPSELYRPDLGMGSEDVESYFRLRVRIEPFKLPGTEQIAFRVLAVNFIHPQESDAVLSCLYGDWSAAQFWITQRAAEGENPTVTRVATTTLRVLQRTPETAPADLSSFIYGNFELVIADDGDGTLAAALENAESANKPGASVETDLVIPASHTAGLYSIVVDSRPEEQREIPPLFVMRHSFISRLSRSLERFQERYTTAASPTPFDPAASGLLGQLGNFNKLRVSLLEEGAADPRRIPLTYPSALTQLPTRKDVEDDDAEGRHDWKIPNHLENIGRDIKPTGPHFTYWLSHNFAQEIADDPDQSEEFRYQAYLNSNQRFQFSGYLEHQYSYRVPFEVGDDGRHIRLGISTEIRHPAELVQRGVVGVNEGEEHPLRHFMSFDHRKDGNERIELHLNKQAVSTLLTAYKNETPETEGTGTSAVQLRELYECLMDLVAALQEENDDEDKSLAELVVERWNFDNQADPDPGRDNSDTSYPSISRNMDWVGTGRLSIGRLLARQSADPDHPNIDSLRRIKALVGDTFSDFVGNIEGLLQEPDRYMNGREFGDDHPWAVLAIPFNESPDLWSWVGKPPDALFKSTNAVRTGLTLRRANGAVVKASYEDAFFQGDLPDTATRDRYAFIEEDFFEDPDLRLSARRQLEGYLDRDDDSPLHSKFMWLASRDTDKRAAPPAPGEDELPPIPSEQLVRSLFGDAQPYLNLPTGYRKDVERVSQMYYVPFAFRPIKGHPAIGDARTTLEFVNFLLRILTSIASRQDVELIDVNKTLTPASGHTRWKQAQGLISGEGGIADQLLGLIERVDDVEAMGKWEDVRERGFFQGVSQLVTEAQVGECGVDARLREMLVERPALFATSKAFGVGIFDPDSFSSRLYSLRVHKQLRGFDTSVSQSSEQRHHDSDRFTFADVGGNAVNGQSSVRFLVDVLDDLSYDNEFEILECEYQDDDGAFKVRDRAWHDRQVDLDGADSSMKLRGGGQARLAEDLIEDRNSFVTDIAEGAAGGPPQKARALELDVVHYNPEWRIQYAPGKYRPIYVLPARRPPVTPKQLLPRQGKAITGDETPFRSTLIAPWGSRPAGGFESVFKRVLSDVLDDKQLLEIAQSTSASKPIRLKRRPETTMQAFADPARLAGWERVESYLSHYYFIVETDEEESTGDIPYSADSLEIDVEVGPTPYESAIPKSVEAKIEENSKLYSWFRYRRLSSQGADKEEPASAQKPESVPMKDVLEELEQWLVNPPDTPADHFTRGLSLLRPREIEHQQKPIKSEGMNKLTRTRVLSGIGAGNTPRWYIADKPFVDGDRDDGIGHVCAVEFFQLLKEDSDEPDKSKYVVRVSVLDEPWQFTRARLRVKRNFRDVDGNNDPDINPCFVQTSPASPWTGYGRQLLTIGSKQFEEFDVPAKVAELTVRPGEGPSLEDWAYAAIGAKASFGPLVHRAVLESEETIGDQSYNYWNRDEAGSNNREVTGYLEQHWQDAHYLQSVNGVLERGSINERGWTYARQLLTTKKKSEVEADTSLQDMFSVVHKSEAPGINMEATVSWHSPEGDEVLRVIWPIKFLPGGNDPGD